MRTRRTLSLILLIIFAISAATGILFHPLIRFTIGLNDEGFWRYLHFLTTNTLFFLIIFHILINSKALGNYLRSARIFSIIAFSLAIILFAGVIYQGVAGSKLGLSGLIYEEEIRRGIRSVPASTQISFPEDFEDGKADGWYLGPGCKIILDNGDHVLNCTGETWNGAIPKVSGWFDYILTTNVKVINGEFQIHFRTNELPFRSGYIFGLSEQGYYLNRQINDEYPHLAGGNSFLELDKWYQVKILLNNKNIKILFDDELKLNYTDIELPYIFGGFKFVSGPNSNVLFDDIVINTNENPQIIDLPTQLIGK